MGAIEALVWPAIVVGVLIAFRVELRMTVESLGRRRWSLSVGGTEVSMEELNEQQTTMVSDLSARVGELEERVAQVKAEPEQRESRATGLSILWVDDRPHETLMLRSALKRQGHMIVAASSTDEALARLQHQAANLVITNVGREEAGVFVADAAGALVNTMRQRNVDTPIVVYAKPSEVRANYSMLTNLDGVTVTSSPTAIWRELAKVSAAL